MRFKMTKVASWSALAALAVASAACNKSSDGQQDQAAKSGKSSEVTQASLEANLDADGDVSQAAADPTGASSQETPAPPAATPGEAVTNFLEAVRRGDDLQAEALLSELARTKTREMDLAVAPPGSSTAKFNVGATEFPYEGADSAHVASTWSDVDGGGYERADEIVWILRKEAGGWRIAGMATKLFEDQPPLILNFEDPQDMVSKQQAADEEIRRRAAAENPTENTDQNPAATTAPTAGQN